MKRILEIITFPFYVIYKIIAFPFLIVSLIIKDTYKRRGNKNSEDIDFLSIGKLLYADCETEFELYYQLFESDIEGFKIKYRDFFKDENISNLTPIEAFCLFGDHKKKLYFMDWRGEENEYEVENFIQTIVKEKINWTNSSKLRGVVDEESQRDGKFIIELYKSIDKDLKENNKKLIFLNTNDDSYVFKIVEIKIYNKIFSIAPTYFCGAENL